jgi:hypothetical protein
LLRGQLEEREWVDQAVEVAFLDVEQKHLDQVDNGMLELLMELIEQWTELVVQRRELVGLLKRLQKCLLQVVENLIVLVRQEDNLHDHL